MFKVIIVIMSLLIVTSAAMADDTPAPNDPYADRGNFRNVGPITNAERNAAWPSRDQAADGYRDAFCRIWDDACTRCERDEGTRLVQCHPMGEAETCERRPIVCTEQLSTQARVCLVFNDGCNYNGNGSGVATAMLCRPIPATARRFRNYSCTGPRRSANATDVYAADEDLAGHWWLVSSAGDTCIVTFNSVTGMGAAEPCSPALKSHLSPHLGSFSTWPKQACEYTAKGERLEIQCPAPAGSKAKPFRLTFSVRNLENPVGIGRFEGWRLLRISTLW